MRASFGNGGWVGLDDIGMPGPVYIRMRLADGRLRISELYMDASQGVTDITQSVLRALPVSRIEAWMNDRAADVVRRIEAPAPDLSILATYFCTWINPSTLGDPRNAQIETWATLCLVSQLPERVVEGSGGTVVRRARRQPRDWKVVNDDRDFTLKRGPTSGLTDEFLRDVSRAYMAAVARGERPNMAIAAQTGHVAKTVQRWVYLARQRGIMPRGRQGKAG
jgi:hypothetical protein